MQSIVCFLLLAGFSLGLLFNPEEPADMFLCQTTVSFCLHQYKHIHNGEGLVPKTHLDPLNATPKMPLVLGGHHN
jgi:hypothetical protein